MKYAAAAGERNGVPDPRAEQLARRSMLAQIGALALGCSASAQQPATVAAFDRLFSSAARRAIESGLAFLAGRQNEDGSFGRSDFSRNVAICGLAGMAMLANGSVPNRGPYGRSLTSIVDLLLGACEGSGLIANEDSASRGAMYGHGFAALFLAEVYGMSAHAELAGKLSRAIKLIVDTQNSEGGWRYKAQRADADLSVTVCQVMALRAARNAGLHVPNDTIERATEYVKRCQNDDGGFRYVAAENGPSEFPRSAAAIVALYSAGVYRGTEIDRGLAYLMQYPPSANSRRKTKYFAYGHYYAVQAMWHAGSPYWESWYPAIRDTLVGQQQDDGSWYDNSGDEYGTAMSCLILQMPRNYLPIFRR